MKLLQITLIFIAVNILNTNGHDIQHTDMRFKPTAVVHQLFEMVRGLIRNGDPAINLPVMDPYYRHTVQLKLELQEEYYNAQINISNFAFSGLGNFQVEENEFLKDEIALFMKIKWPILKLEAGYYEMQGSIKNVIPLAGRGDMYVEADNVYLSSKIYLRQSTDGKSILIDKIENTSFTIERISSRTRLDGIFDDIFNAWVEDLLASYLTRFSRKIVSIYKDNFMSLSNSVLKEYETWYILLTIL